MKKLLLLETLYQTIWKIKSPKIGITSINPHAGEEGSYWN